MHEFPLVIFTLFMQGAVGFTLMLCFTAGQMPRAGRHTLATLPALVCTGIAAALGLLASTLHLGYPLNSFNALRHLSSSWLSRRKACKPQVRPIHSRLSSTSKAAPNPR